ncbi:hypothetical protein BC943DRAFT_198138 [Umbelopsis sp. AD052]|nr:hypothetical protein BC943DRAFT_198138 [Umbelopsis sp. AD052]
MSIGPPLSINRLCNFWMSHFSFTHILSADWLFLAIGSAMADSPTRVITTLVVCIHLVLYLLINTSHLLTCKQ